jgi:hypothetical protein
MTMVACQSNMILTNRNDHGMKNCAHFIAHTMYYVPPSSTMYPQVGVVRWD